MADSPLFKFDDERVLTRQCLESAVHEGLIEARIDYSKYNRHSFHIGAATTAAARGLKTASSRLWEDGRAWLTYNT